MEQGGVKPFNSNISVAGDVIFTHFTAGENLPSHSPVCLIGDLLYRLDATKIEHAFGYVGWTVTSTPNGERAKIQTNGTLNLQGWSLVPGVYYQAGNSPSQIAIIEQPGIVFKKVVGLALTSDKLLILQHETILK